MSITLCLLFVLILFSCKQNGKDKESQSISVQTTSVELPIEFEVFYEQFHLDSMFQNGSHPVSAARTAKW